MKKLRLDLDALVVETFATRPCEDDPRGTVRAHDATEYPCNDSDLQCAPTGFYYETCNVSCAYMCFPSGNGTCNC